MLQDIKQSKWFYLIGFLFIAANSYLISKNELYLAALPIGLIAIYAAIYHLDKLFLFIVAFAPLSVNIEEYVNGSLGLFLPTEPLLFGMLLLIVIMQFFTKWFDKSFLTHPITIIFIFIA